MTVGISQKEGVGIARGKGRNPFGVPGANELSRTNRSDIFCSWCGSWWVQDSLVRCEMRGEADAKEWMEEAEQML